MLAKFEYQIPVVKMSASKELLVIIGLVVLVPFGYAQDIRYPNAARYTAMAAYSKNFVDVLSCTFNQATLGSMKTAGAGVYAERRFLVEELNLYTLTACLPFSFGGIGVSAEYFGYDAYKETQLSLSYGKNLGKINIGVQFNYYRYHIAGYGNNGFINIEGGAILQVSEQLYAGLHVFNPTRSKFGQNNNNIERLASVYTAGLGYEVSDKVFLGAEFIKEEDKSININAGLDYVFAKKFFARLGISTEAGNLYFGAGWRWNIFRIDITWSYHTPLGFTPGLMLVIQRPNTTE